MQYVDRQNPDTCREDAESFIPTVLWKGQFQKIGNTGQVRDSAAQTVGRSFSFCIL